MHQYRIATKQQVEARNLQLTRSRLEPGPKWCSQRKLECRRAKAHRCPAWSVGRKCEWFGQGGHTSWSSSNLDAGVSVARRSEEHKSELQSLMRISYAVFCLKKKTSKDLN